MGIALGGSMKIILKDGNVIEIEKPISAFELAKSISEGLAKVAVACKIDGKLCAMNDIVDSDCNFEVLTFAEEDGRKVYRHTCSHILAQAVKNIFPTAKLAIGPAIENGFYYDIDFKTPITFEDLERIEKEMKAIIKAKYPIERFELSRKDALKLMSDFDEPYKLELINELPDDAVISFYKQGDFTDLCAGPHLHNTGMVKAFKLTSLTGAYWRGNEKNKMLSRIYGTCFDKKSDLQDYLMQMEEAKKRDHNKIGRELGYFMTDENIGQGLPLLMPKGAKTIQVLQRFVEDTEAKQGYMLTKTPYMAKRELYQISGHWDHYQDGMFIMGDANDPKAEVFALRPMTCPFQYTIYNNGLKSYRDLPCRYGETSTLFRNESSGEMHGLIRLRQFTISEGHLVCTPEQLEEEFKKCVELAKYMLTAVGLQDDISYRFSKYDPKDTEKFIQDADTWNSAEETMGKILDHLGIKYSIGIGEAAFYGPKLDIQIKNVWGKEDTLITIQVDMFLAENFDMSYIDENGDKKRPYIIHRTSIGCYERTLALVLEKFAGAMPLWLAPTQVKVLSLTDRTAENARDYAEKLNATGIRVEVDNRSETIGYKIRSARMEKVPYIVVIGDKEAESGNVSVKRRGEENSNIMSEDEFVLQVLREVKELKIF